MWRTLQSEGSALVIIPGGNDVPGAERDVRNLSSQWLNLRDTPDATNRTQFVPTVDKYTRSDFLVVPPLLFHQSPPYTPIPPSSTRQYRRLTRPLPPTNTQVPPLGIPQNLTASAVADGIDAELGRASRPSGRLRNLAPPSIPRGGCTADPRSRHRQSAPPLTPTPLPLNPRAIPTASRQSATARRAQRSKFARS